jgi:hypothetical protein
MLCDECPHVNAKCWHGPECPIGTIYLVLSLFRIRKRARNEAIGVKVPAVEEIPAPVRKPMPVPIAR